MNRRQQAYRTGLKPGSHGPQQLFTDTFRKNYKDGRDKAFQQAMIENDLWDWKPVSKIVFCHGDKD